MYSGFFDRFPSDSSIKDDAQFLGCVEALPVTMGSCAKDRQGSCQMMALTIVEHYIVVVLAGQCIDACIMQYTSTYA